MAKRMTKAEREAMRAADFNRLIGEWLEAHGATRMSGIPWNAWHLDTKAGRLVIHPIDTWVALRFEEPGRANALLGASFDLNPYSGKWNIHVGDDVLDNLEVLERKFAMVRL